MSTLCIKTGMASEYQLAKRHAAMGTQILTGEYTADDLDHTVQKDCKAIISFGLCGGIGPEAQVGECFISTVMVTPTGNYTSDPAWMDRIFTKTHFPETHWWSSGEFNMANTTAQRWALYKKTGCQVIDDESAAVFEFAKKRGIAAMAMRAVSDALKDNLPQAVVNAINPDGTTNVWNVIKSVFFDPKQIGSLWNTYQEYQTSIKALEHAAVLVGPSFQWQ